MTKRQLARHLNMSARWIEQRQVEGLPSRLRDGRREYQVSEVDDWLRRRAGSNSEAHTPVASYDGRNRRATAAVVPIGGRAEFEPWVTKTQLAKHFHFSRRWVELRQREGLPSELMGGERRYRISQAEAWFSGRRK